MNQPNRQSRERLAKCVLLGGFVFLVVWPFASVGEIASLTGCLGVSCAMLAAYFVVRNDPGIKSLLSPWPGWPIARLQSRFEKKGGRHAEKDAHDI